MTPAPNNRPKRRWLQTAIGSVVVIVGTASVLAGIAYAKIRQIEAARSAQPPPEMAVAVKYSKTTDTTFRRSSVVVGNVLAPESIMLRTELPGVVIDVPMKPGGQVQKGDVLVQLDARTEEALLKSAEATRKLAETTLQRSRKLNQQNANSESELDIAEAELTRREAEVDELRVRIDKKTLRAPFNAQVGLFDLHVGQYLNEGSEITTLEGIADYLNVDFAMPAHVADAVAIGDEVEVRVGQLATPALAKIVAVDASADAVSRSVTARAKLFNPPAALQPRDSAHVTVYYGEPILACLIPATAVRRGPSGTFVYIVSGTEGGDRAIPRKVEVVGGGGSYARVISGLTAGEQVVADGSFKVFDKALLMNVDLVIEAEPVP